MDGILTGRRRRPLWGWLAVLFAIALGTSLVMAERARNEAVRDATARAELLAQTQLTTLLVPSDLLAPMHGDRAAELSSAIRNRITAVSSVDEVRIYSAFGRILYARDAEIVGTRPSYLRDLTFEVAGGDAQTRVRGGIVQTYVPIWLSPGGTVVVAEASQSVDALTAPATARWTGAAVGTGLLLAGAVAMVVVTTLDRTSRVSQASRREVRRSRFAEPAGYRPAGLAEAHERRLSTDARADTAERRASELHKQLKDARDRIAALERERSRAGNDAEVAELRVQLAKSTDLLNMAELDGKALRERLVARQQELEEARALLGSAGAAEETAELRRRLESAEAHSDELAETVGRLQAELETTSTQLSMTRLSEALREIEQSGGVHGGETEDELEPPVEIRGSRRFGRKVG